MVERDSRVDDADRDTTSVPGRVRGDELRAAGVAGRHVRVVVRRASARGWLRYRIHRTLGNWVGNRNDLVEVDRLHTGQQCRCFGLARRYGRSDVPERVVAIANDAAERLHPTDDLPGRATFGRDQQRHRALAVGDGDRQLLAIGLRQSVARRRLLGTRRVTHPQWNGHQRRDQNRSQPATTRHTPSPCFRCQGSPVRIRASVSWGRT